MKDYDFSYIPETILAEYIAIDSETTFRLYLICLFMESILPERYIIE